jgi:hypothetical protein
LRTFFGLSQAIGTEPPTSQMPCFFAWAARNFWIGPLPSLFPNIDLVGFLHAHDGEKLRQGDQLGARRHGHLDEPLGFARLAATFGPEAICTAATRMMPPLSGASFGAARVRVLAKEEGFARVTGRSRWG